MNPRNSKGEKRYIVKRWISCVMSKDLSQLKVSFLVQFSTSELIECNTYGCAQKLWGNPRECIFKVKFFTFRVENLVIKMTKDWAKKKPSTRMKIEQSHHNSPQRILKIKFSTMKIERWGISKKNCMRFLDKWNSHTTKSIGKSHIYIPLCVQNSLL